MNIVKLFLAAFHSPESLRSEGRAPRGTRAASGRHSFSDCVLYRERAKSILPGIAYLAVTVVALMAITLTGHLGGTLGGVETP
jgi:hypothetical protein